MCHLLVMCMCTIKCMDLVIDESFRLSSSVVVCYPHYVYATTQSEMKIASSEMRVQFRAQRYHEHMLSDEILEMISQSDSLHTGEG